MTTLLRERAGATVHDQVVSLVAQRWAKAFVCKVTIQTGDEQHAWESPEHRCDIVGSYVSSGGETIEWMAEVETEISLMDIQVVDKWKRTMRRGIPFYLVVPQGLKESVQKLSQDASIVISCIYEYTFIEGVCHIF